MKKSKLLISLALVLMFTMVLGQSVVFAQDAPPSIDSPFDSGDDDDDTPPTLSGSGDTTVDDDEPPVLSGDNPPLEPPPDPDDSNDGEIPKSGPEMAFLLVPSLALGYAYRKNKSRK